jgi:hypothetical protein
VAQSDALGYSHKINAQSYFETSAICGSYVEELVSAIVQNPNLFSQNTHNEQYLTTAEETAKTKPISLISFMVIL